MQFSKQLLFINLIVYIISIYVAKPNITYYNPQQNNCKKGFSFFFFLLIINSVLAFWAADTYHSWDSFILAQKFSFYEIEDYEGIYNWLATVCNNEYLLWRACIWVPACLFMYYTAKVLKLENRNFLVAILLFGSFLSFTRGMLGHTMMLFGTVLFVNKNHKWKLVGLLIVFASYFFHKSMFINIAFAVLALYPMGKKSFAISLIAFPFLTIVATYLINGIASGEIEMALGEGAGGIGDRTETYASGEKAEMNSLGIFYHLLEIVPTYLVLFYLYKEVIVSNLFSKDSVYKYLYRLTYVSIYIGSLFYFVDTSDAMYSRLTYMGSFPLLFVLGKVLSLKKRSSNFFRFIMLLQLFGIFFRLVYKFYSW